MVSLYWYSALLVALGLERLVELRISRRNLAWALAQGGVEYGAGHFRWMKLLHAAFLLGCGAEAWLLERPFRPLLGWSMLGVALLAQALRYWTIATLGKRWNVRVIVVPGLPVVTAGPFRFLRHPNYLAVVAEGIALPLIHGAVAVAVVFSLLDAWLLTVRIRCEEAALRQHCGFDEGFGTRRSSVPRAPSAS